MRFEQLWWLALRFELKLKLILRYFFSSFSSSFAGWRFLGNSFDFPFFAFLALQKKTLSAREHLWEEASMYTLQDLVEACYGVTDMSACETLKPLLLRLTRHCRQHAAKCPHCTAALKI